MSDETNNKDEKPKNYEFGGISEYSLEQIEAEVLNDSVYLDVFAGSDENYKKDVVGLKSSISKILKLRPIQYKYKTEDFPNKKFPNNLQYGFLAQEVRDIYPELVREDENNLLELNYHQLIPILVQAIQDQNKKIETLESRVAMLNRNDVFIKEPDNEKPFV